MKVLKSLITVMLGASILFTVGCNNNSNVQDDYDIATRVPLDKNEITYTVPERDTYYNFIEVYDENNNPYRVGDPFVIRFDGKYYMYSSVTTRTKTESLDGKIMVWSSDNLVDWTWEAVACEDMEGHEHDCSSEQCSHQHKNGATYVAYAPEVIYYRGYFYLCESQFSNGHFIFKSESPVGPFERISENLGHGIDGSFYIGDDGLYMVHLDANTKNLSYAKVNLTDGKATLGTSISVKNASTGGWTEGPHWFRRNDYKYMTYTGTNVRSASYRVDYSYTKGDLLTELTQPEDHILLLSTDMPYTPASGYNEETGKYIGYNSSEGNLAPPRFSGLGHSSNVIAPNLDGIYTAYHNEYTVSGNKFDRRLNIDQYFTNDSLVHANGIGVYDKMKPNRPNYEIYGDTSLIESGDYLLSQYSTDKVYTVEYNFKNLTGQNGGVVLGYQNSSNYNFIAIEDGVMNYYHINNGSRILKSSKILDSMNDYTKLNTIRVENGYGKIYIYYNNILVMTSTETANAGKIGYSKGLEIGSTQFANDAFGTSDFEAMKNLPSEFPAYTYLKGVNRGYSLKNGKINANGVRQGEKETSKKVANTTTGEEFTAITLEAGDWVKYAVNAGFEGGYALNLQVGKQSKGAIIEAIIDGERIYKMQIPSNIDFGNHDYAYVNAGYLDLGEAGYHTLKLRVYSGILDVATIRCESASIQPKEINYTFSEENEETENLVENVQRLNGFYRITNKGLRTDNNDTAVFTLAESGRSDIDVSVDVMLNSLSDKGGLFIRMKNYVYPMFSYATTEVGQSYQGYYVRVDCRAVVLLRYDYNLRTCQQKILDTDKQFVAGTVRSLRVVAVGNNIKVFVDGKLMIDYDDYNAFLSGATGIYAENSRIYYKNFSYKEY